MGAARPGFRGGYRPGPPSILDGLQPVAAVRSDPEFHHSHRRRLLFVRFDGVALFWRLDLSVRAASVANDPDYDAGNPAARAADDEWERPASTLANALGAVKAVARLRFDDACGLLQRGFARIDEHDNAIGNGTDDTTRLATTDGTDPISRLATTARTHLITRPATTARTHPVTRPATGAWAGDIARLACAAVVRDPSLDEFARQVLAVVADHVPTSSGIRTADSKH